MYVFADLNIYSKALKFAAVVELAAESFPPSTHYFTDRLNKSAESIPTNIAEAHGRWQDDQCGDFYWKAREATQECSGLLDIAARQGLISEGLKLSLRSKLDVLHKLILEAVRKVDKGEKKEESTPELAGPIGLKVF